MPKKRRKLQDTARITRLRHQTGERVAWHDLESLRDVVAVTSWNTHGHTVAADPGTPLVVTVVTSRRHMKMILDFSITHYFQYDSANLDRNYRVRLLVPYFFSVIDCYIPMTQSRH
jgi:hypothetical protein